MNYLYFSNLLSLGVLTYLAKGFLTIRKDDIYLNVIFFQIAYIFTCFIADEVIFPNYLMVLLFYLIYLILMFSSNFKYCIFILLLYILISVTSFLVIRTIVTYLISNNLIYLDNSFNIVIKTISTIIDYLICRAYIKINKLSNTFNISNFLVLIFIYPLIIVIFIALIYNGYILINNKIFINVVCSILLFSNIIIFIIFYNLIKNIEIKNSLNLSLERERILNNKYEIINENYNNNFNLLHKILHYCKSLTNHVDNNDYSSLKLTINELSEVTFKEFELMHTNLAVLNFLIANKYEKIYKNSINLNTSILYNDFSFIKLFDLMEMFSLLLDVSIDSCIFSSNEKRNISIKSLEKGNGIIIQFIFPYISKITINNEIYKLVEYYNGNISEDINQSLGYKSVIIFFSKVQ